MTEGFLQSVSARAIIAISVMLASSREKSFTSCVEINSTADSSAIGKLCTERKHTRNTLQQYLYQHLDELGSKQGLDAVPGSPGGRGVRGSERSDGVVVALSNRKTMTTEAFCKQQ